MMQPGWPGRIMVVLLSFPEYPDGCELFQSEPRHRKPDRAM